MKKLYASLIVFTFLESAYSQVNIEWQKSLGGPGIEFGYTVRQSQDGGYIVAGYSDSAGSNITVNYGGYDYWLVKLDTAGLIQWQKSLGGSATDNAYDVMQTTDSGYMVAGGTTSDDTNVTVNHGSFDVWIVKTDSGGFLQWEKSLGGSNCECEKEHERKPGRHQEYLFKVSA